jgi:hippurate hydrolase
MQKLKILSEPLVKKINEIIEADKRSLTDLFKHIYQNPELSHQEEKTSLIIKKELDLLGYPVHPKIGETGVVGILENGKGPVVMYRADATVVLNLLGKDEYLVMKEPITEHAIAMT